MLIDTRENEQQTKGFNPNVQNRQINATCSTGDKVGYIALGVVTIGLFFIYSITKKNKFNRLQMQINEKASGIQIQLAQRRDTLVKLVDATKSSMDFEKGLLSDITKLRSYKITDDNLNEANQKIDSAFARLLATYENYPKIASTEAIKNLMNSAEYLEQEIAASRRLYNSVVTQFNQELFTFPAKVVATKQGLHTFALFNASEEQQKDVPLKLNK